MPYAISELIAAKAGQGWGNRLLQGKW